MGARRGARAAFANPTKSFKVRTTLLHELGHVIGLNHVDDPRQVMSPKAALRLKGYQPGDLAGLRVLGQGPCRPDV